MQPSTPRFAAAVLSDHAIVTYFEIWQPNATSPIFSSRTAPKSQCALIDGNVTLSKDQDTRGQCSITLVSPDNSLIPSTNNAPLTPWGNEIRIWSGIQYNDGTTEYIPMGCYRIYQVQITEQQGAIQIIVSGYDRSHNIALNVTQIAWPDTASSTYLGDTTVFPNGAPWPAMIQFVLTNFWNPIQFSGTWEEWVLQENDQTDTVIVLGVAQPAVFSQGTNMWTQMRQYAQAAGCDMVFTRQGVCDFYPDPIIAFFDATTVPTPVTSFVEGENAQFDQLQRTLSDATAFNRVIVNGSGTVLGENLTSFVFYNDGLQAPGIFADDNDPTSPTYIGVVDQNISSSTYGQVLQPSNYGVVTNVVSSNLLVSQNQVNNFATLTIRQNVGSRENLVINSMLTDPRLEVDDVVSVTRTVDGVVNVVYIIESITIPLSMKSAMQMTVREKRNLVASST
jgi:hypothetical protein